MCFHIKQTFITKSTQNSKLIQLFFIGPYSKKKPLWFWRSVWLRYNVKAIQSRVPTCVLDCTEVFKFAKFNPAGHLIPAYPLPPYHRKFKLPLKSTIFHIVNEIQTTWRDPNSKLEEELCVMIPHCQINQTRYCLLLYLWLFNQT